MKPNEITYYSAVDWWIVLVILSPIISGLYLVATGNPRDGVSAILVGLGVLLFLGIICFPCRYTLTERSLLIRCGLLGNFIKQEVELRRITNVSRSYNPLSAPATSLKRVKIKFEGGFWGFSLISPKDREGFIDELNRRRDLLKETDRRT